MPNTGTGSESDREAFLSREDPRKLPAPSVRRALGWDSEHELEATEAPQSSQLGDCEVELF